MSTYNFRRSKTELNPDEDFVLHGKHSAYWRKPDYAAKNSEITLTTSNLSQKTRFNSDIYRDRKYTHSLSDLAHNLESLSKEFDHSLSRSRSNMMDNYRQSKEFRESLRTDVTEDELLGNSRGYSEEKLIRNTYISPILSSHSLQRAYSARPYKAPSRSPPKTVASVLPPQREDGTRKGLLLEKFPLSGSESDALSNFPKTLGSSYELEKMNYLLGKGPIVASDMYARPKSASCLNKTSKSVTLKEPYEDKFDPHQNLNKLYLMSSEAPTIGSAPAMIISPYDCELNKLRMERLRIEEERLWELKRLAECEKIRGPKPKWYESKGPDFYYESHKNTEMIKQEKHWEDLMSYRTELMNSSYSSGARTSHDNIYRDL